MVKRYLSVRVAPALVGILLVLLSTSSFAGRVSDLSLGPVGGVGPVTMIGIILPSRLSNTGGPPQLTLSRYL